MEWYHFLIIAVGILVVLGAGFGLGVGYRKKVAEREIGSAEAEATRLINEAIRSGENRKKEMLLEAKDEIHKSRTEHDKEVKERRAELSKQERRLEQKEATLDKKTEAFERKEEELAKRLQKVSETQAQADQLKQQQLTELEKISGLTQDQAKDFLLHSIEDEVRHEAAMKIKEIEAQLKDEAEEKGREIIATAIQRCAADHAAETTVSVVTLPNDEMKGRIIGREGRNIRTLETITGVDLIIDDTPETITVSSFDPVRREIARLALEKLIVDGRIHPTRIEDMVEKARKEVDRTIREEGERACYETGVHNLNPELVKILGRQKYRTSYGQNVLNHSIEVAHIAGLMAAELGVDVAMAKRAGLLHDLGKSIDHEVEGSHVQLGADLARKYKENPVIVNAIEAHHGDVEPKTVIAVLVQLRNRNVQIGQISIMFEVTVVVHTGIAFWDVTKTLYSGIVAFVSGQIVDAVVYRFDYSKVALIVTTEHEAIARIIDERLDRGATYLHGAGSYTKQEMEIVLTVVKKRQLAELKEIVMSIDEKVFVIVQEAHQVLGDGFTDYFRAQLQ